MLLLFRFLFSVLLLFLASSSWAAMHVTGGDFTYQVESSAETLSYQVKAARYHGVAAWHIRWHSSQLDADHFIRRDSGAPIFVRRVLHHLQQVVEITYRQPSDGEHADGVTRYRLYLKGQLVKERQIVNPDLVDLATLPQLLRQSDWATATSLRAIEVINYADGNVYALKVSRVGTSQFAMGDLSVPSIRYQIEVDSWLSIFTQSIQMDIPVDSGIADFAAYSGPDFMGGGDQIRLHLLTAVAVKGG
ncbi:MAG: hypothetical protein R8J85_00890 [Mariprofundales bacterium]